MKIYTKKGDAGMTSLASGERVRKSDVRVDLYGIVDEVNSQIGAAAAFLSSSPELRDELQAVQCVLFELGSELAGYKGGAPAVIEDDVKVLEASIDRMTEKIPPLRAFVLPGGDVSAGLLHVARSTTRRLERRMEEVLSEKENSLPLRYINRLSDYLFTAARYANVLAGRSDIPWKARSRKT